jgi:hypothetical protein
VVSRGSAIGARAAVSLSLIQKRARMRWFHALRLALSEKRMPKITEKAEKPERAMEELR